MSPLYTEEEIEAEAKEMAEAVNGGKWERDYTPAQKEGWKLKVKWARRKYLLEWRK